MKFADFLKMYYLLGDKVLKRSAEPKVSCQKIIDQLLAEKVITLKDEPLKDKKPTGEEIYNNVQLGISKIFFRVGVLGKIEAAREAKMAKLIPTCQAAIRGLMARRIFNASKERETSVKIIQKAIRQYVELKNWPWFLLYQKVKPELVRIDYDELARQQEAEKNALLRDIAKMKAEKERADIKIKELEGDISRTQSDLDNTKNKLDSLEGTHGDLEDAVKALKMDLADKEADLDDLVQKNMGGDTKLRDLKREVDESVAELAELESNAAKKKNRKSSTRTTN
jgi:myosin protein heavy chain